MKYSLSLLFLIAVISISSVINAILQGSIVTSKHCCKKSWIKRSECPINYYANCVASYNLILSGDVKLNPGPGFRVKNNAAKCSLCNKAVGTNRKYVCKNYSPAYLQRVYINWVASPQHTKSKWNDWKQNSNHSTINGFSY